MIDSKNYKQKEKNHLLYTRKNLQHLVDAINIGHIIQKNKLKYKLFFQHQTCFVRTIHLFSEDIRIQL